MNPPTKDFIKKLPYTEYIASIKVGYVSLLSRVRKIGNKVSIGYSDHA